ncbi:hypothetical protein [Bathymodiolus japonicus methanotrophic gill symbiont]|uniref:hypothetical protein n=1 Tax=Bathymodiolus japonicus methanotrophic gill symbiont TaxID=113269 RepID=UPI001C8EBD4F|nr:hypothetical protein [Bathymodiolus japonicus methanotrophic gill symbiont]
MSTEFVENLYMKVKAKLAGNGIALSKICKAGFRTQIYSQNCATVDTHPTGDKFLRSLFLIFSGLQGYDRVNRTYKKSDAIGRFFVLHKQQN